MSMNTLYPVVRPHIHALYLLMTNRCNLTCKHCCVWSSPKGSYGLELPVAIRAIDEVFSMYGSVRMILGGGEPLMRLRDTVALLRHSTSRSMNSLLLTNGMLINACVAAQLSSIEGLRIRVSLDGTTKERHDFIRGNGSFDKTIKGITHLKRSGFNLRKLEIGCTIFPGWEDEMENILHFCERYGIEVIKLKAISKLGRATEFWTNIPISKPDEDTKVYREKLDAGIYDAYKEKWNVRELNDISFGELNIYYDGGVYAYSFMGDTDQKDAYLGNIYEKTLKDIMRDPMISKPVVQKFLKYATGPARSLRCLNITRV